MCELLVGLPDVNVLGVPGGDLVTPAQDGPAELANLGRARVVLEIGAEPGDELESQGGIVVVIDRADDFLCVPRRADLAARIAGSEQTDELRSSPVVEALVGLSEQSTAPIQRIVLAAQVTHGLVLQPTAALIEAGVGQLHEMKRISDLGCCGKHRVERQAPWPRKVQHREADLVKPRLVTMAEPPTCPSGGAARIVSPA